MPYGSIMTHDRLSTLQPFSFHLQTRGEDVIMLQMKKLRLREITPLAQGASHGWWS